MKLMLLAILPILSLSMHHETITGIDGLSPNEYMHTMSGLWADSLQKKKATKAKDMGNSFCADVKYSSSCTNEGCDMFPKAINGRKKFLDWMQGFDDMFDEVTINTDNGAFTMTYRKGECSGTASWDITIDYDSERKCISKWYENLDSIQITENDKHTNSGNSLQKLMSKISINCAYDETAEIGPSGITELGAHSIYNRNVGVKDTIMNDNNKGYFVTLLMWLLISLLSLNVLLLTYTNCCKSTKGRYTQIDMVTTSDEDV